MTELNETIEEVDPEAENVSQEDNAITGTESDSNSEEESTDENPFFAKNWMLIAKPKKLQFESQNLKSDYAKFSLCLLYTSPSPRDLSTSRMPSSA